MTRYIIYQIIHPLQVANICRLFVQNSLLYNIKLLSRIQKINLWSGQLYERKENEMKLSNCTACYPEGSL